MTLIASAIRNNPMVTAMVCFSLPPITLAARFTQSNIHAREICEQSRGGGSEGGSNTLWSSMGLQLRNTIKNGC